MSRNLKPCVKLFLGFAEAAEDLGEPEGGEEEEEGG
jgi:hypothetical protein